MALAALGLIQQLAPLALASELFDLTCQGFEIDLDTGQDPAGSIRFGDLGGVIQLPILPLLGTGRFGFLQLLGHQLGPLNDRSFRQSDVRIQTRRDKFR